MSSNQFKYTTCWQAAEIDDLNELKRMHQAGMPLFLSQSIHDWWSGTETPNCTALAAKNGHLDCLRYAHENGCEWHFTTLSNAIKLGHTDCLRYAIENGCAIEQEISAFAAHAGHLDCLRLCHEKGVLWATLTTEWAALKGNLECLRFAHENGCKWNKELPRVAAEYGQLDCLRYAIENGCPYDNKNKKLTESIESIFKFNDIRKCSSKSFENHLSDNVVKHVIVKFI